MRSGGAAHKLYSAASIEKRYVALAVNPLPQEGGRGIGRNSTTCEIGGEAIGAIGWCQMARTRPIPRRGYARRPLPGEGA